MTVRRSLTRRIAAATTAFIAIAAVAATGATPLSYTEASWVDDVFVNASLQANEHAGINSAGAAGSNGSVRRLATTSNIRGVTAGADNVGRPPYANSGDKNFAASGILNLVSLKSNAKSCARAGETRCPTEPANTPSVKAFAQSDFNSMEIATSENIGLWITRYTGGTTNPIRTTASCTPGNVGSVGIRGGAGIELRRAGWLNLNLSVPTVSGQSNQGTGWITGLWRYRATLSYLAETDINYARSDVQLTVVADPIGVADESWTVTLLLSHAECGLSKPIGTGIAPATAGTGGFTALTEDDALMLDHKADETAVPEDGPDEAREWETTTSTSPTPLVTSTNPGNSSTTSASTSTRPGTTTNTAVQVPTTTRRTTTITSKVPTVSAAPTSITTPPATQVTTSTSAAPAPAIPDEPGTLSPTARLEDVGTVEVGGEDLVVVVVPGDTVPTGTRAAVAALDTWINDGRQPSGDWTTFTSTDPDVDGWRWAAINGKTGTVVYIR